MVRLYTKERRVNMAALPIIENILGSVDQAMNEGREKLFEAGENARNEQCRLQTELYQLKISMEDANIEDSARKSPSKDHETVWESRFLQIEEQLKELEEVIQQSEKLLQQLHTAAHYLKEDVPECSDPHMSSGLHVLRLYETAQKKLARDIHDGPAQLMANAALHAEILARTAAKGSMDQLGEETEILKKTIKESLLETRRIIFDLRAPELHQSGLIQALAKYAETMQNRSGVRIRVKTAGEAPFHYPDLEAAAYRFVQEAVQNALKHAGAGTIFVKAEMQPQNLFLTVSDDGGGFSTAAHREDSFGLKGMKERIQLLGGQVTIDSGQGEGTTITAAIPVTSESENYSGGR
jgi:two-component system, NarL family, sensor histidine kinase DegS